MSNKIKAGLYTAAICIVTVLIQLAIMIAPMVVIWGIIFVLVASVVFLVYRVLLEWLESR